MPSSELDSFPAGEIGAGPTGLRGAAPQRQGRRMNLGAPRSPDSRRRNRRGSAMLALYCAAGRMVSPALGLALAWRERRGKEDPLRRAERLGMPSAARPAGPLVWVHAASVGETNAVLPLIGRLSGEGIAVLLTTGTVTSAEIAGRRLGGGAIHQFAPIDVLPAVERFLRHWRPDLAIFAESELWPAAMQALDRLAIPLVLVNGRVSERSFRRWRPVAPLAAALMGKIDCCLVQTAADAARLEVLGAAEVIVCGNLKFDVPPPPADANGLAVLREEVGGRLVLLAASTHPGEEATALHVQAEAAKAGLAVLTILAPRHPGRGPELEAEVAAAGLAAARRSRGEPIGPATAVYIADSIGEMGLWYRLADLVILGGSLARRGGQNPIEAAKLGVPILHGPHVGNFSDVYAALAEAGAAKACADRHELAVAAVALLGNPAERARLAREAAACVERFAGALDRTMAALDPYLVGLRSENGGVAAHA